MGVAPRILGIDPGLRLTGYACVQAHPLSEPTLIEAGVLKLATREPAGDDRAALVPGVPQAVRTRVPRPSAASVSSRLVELERDLCELLDRLAPALVAVESLFAHYKHPATAITMGHARGVILLCIRRLGLDLIELKPNAVKKSMTGHGHAAKAQMQEAVRLRLGLATRPEPPDVADAIAIAICAASRRAIECPVPNAS
jgi:crossover junction endodeoxyribonuclease RuvC